MFFAYLGVCLAYFLHFFCIFDWDSLYICTICAYFLHKTAYSLHIRHIFAGSIPASPVAGQCGLFLYHSSKPSNNRFMWTLYYSQAYADSPGYGDPGAPPGVAWCHSCEEANRTICRLFRSKSMVLSGVIGVMSTKLNASYAAHARRHLASDGPKWTAAESIIELRSSGRQSCQCLSVAAAGKHWRSKSSGKDQTQLEQLE